jgi:hypothetical protein
MQLYKCLCQLVIIRYSLFEPVFVINRSFILFIVRLFAFIFIDALLVLLLFKRGKRTILILNHVQVFRSRATRSSTCCTRTVFNIIISSQ